MYSRWYDKDTCAKCGEKLYQRDDDREETVKSRLEVYESQTAPLIEYYKELGVLKDVDGSQDIFIAQDIFANFPSAFACSIVLGNPSSKNPF